MVFKKQHLKNCMSEISVLWVPTGRHFAMTNKLRHLNVKTDYITHNKVWHREKTEACFLISSGLEPHCITSPDL